MLGRPAPEVIIAIVMTNVDAGTAAPRPPDVESIESDRQEVKDVVVRVADKLFAAKRYGWRSPVRRSASLPGVK
ncbi:MAG: hypothetical protein ACM4AI_25140 [Acidobacteriota bacterium]